MNAKQIFILLLFLLQLGVTITNIHAAEPVPLAREKITFFETQIRPLLAEKCWSCHGEKQQKGGLRLDHPTYILTGGETGPAIVLGKADKSLLIEAVNYESFEMPPNNNQLKPAEIELLVKWVNMGAPWPLTEQDKLVNIDRVNHQGKFSEQERAWWAIQPVKKFSLPQFEHPYESSHPVDLFLLAKLSAQQLTPAPKADKITLIRRVYLDLIGLPPSLAEVTNFLKDDSPTAFSDLVDELLSSPRYGERWGRIWLDVVRYADGDGYKADHFRPHAWRYRDYVINSFNADKPYDRFVQEQLAGDELFPTDADAQIATGYLCNGIYEYNNRDVEGQWQNILVDLTNNTADVFLGLGLQCAQCHDHKYDPLLQEDYYRLQAFFAPVELQSAGIVMTPQQKQTYEKQLLIYQEKTSDIEQQLASLQQKYISRIRQSALERFPLEVQEYIFKDYSQLTPLQKQHYLLAFRQVEYDAEGLDKKFNAEEKEKILALRRELAKYDHLKPLPLTRAQIARDISSESPPVYIPKKAKRNIEPGIPTILNPLPSVIEKPADPRIAEISTGRRSTLAKWITHPENPLTSRVIVNRIWQAHFGKGLFPNANDFGNMGGTPSHPELLDYLAKTFVEQGWSIKNLHRLMLTSHAYQMSSSHPRFTEFQLRDPVNSWFWRADTRRMDAEQIRDSLLLICGELDFAMGGVGVKSDIPRRAVYTRYMRNTRDPLMDVFDLPLFFTSSSSRDTTTTPIQSLLLINSPMMHKFSKELSDMIIAEASDPTVQVELLWQKVYGRKPTLIELETSISFLNNQEQITQKNKKLELAAKANLGKLPYRSGSAVVIDPEKPDNLYRIKHNEKLNIENFTLETYFEIRSVYETAHVRPLISKQDAAGKKQGWQFGVTGKGSRRKPQTLVLQMFGTRADGSFGEGIAFSDQLVELNKPYYAAVTIKLAVPGKPGLATFYLKDLSNDDEPISIAKVEFNIMGDISCNAPITIGGNAVNHSGMFDGLIDEVRLSSGVLADEQLIINAEANLPSTLAYWRFEPDLGLLKDSSGHGYDIFPNLELKTTGTNQEKVLADLAHVLLNSNEFLYID